MASGQITATLPQEATLIEVTEVKHSTAIPDTWDEEVDVVVVGSGFAGLAAAIEAHDAGSSVKIVEKMDKPGGNSWINGGQVAAAGSQQQKAAGIEDSAELMLEDMEAAGLNLNYPKLARLVAENSNETVEWTKRRVGAEYKDRINILGGHSVPRTLQTANGHGSEIVGKQVEALRKDGVPISCNCQLVQLLRGDDGRVQGVELRDGCRFDQPGSGTPKFVRARKAVVLACGGFSRDLHFRTVQDPRLNASFDSTNHPGATAEGLISALRIGAAPVQLSWIQLGPWASPDEEGMGVGPGFAGGSGFPYGIMVDPATGRRFVNELADRRIRADAIVAVGHPAINFCDSYGINFVWWGLERALDTGVVKKFDSLEALAAAYDIPFDELSKTIERYNGFVEKRDDQEFGKLFVDNVKPVGAPPFYAMRVWPKAHHTMGGVEVNEKAQVLDLDGEPIAGLYAAGEVVGGVHGACRLGSVAIIDCLVFGRIAGKQAGAGTVRETAAA